MRDHANEVLGKVLAERARARLRKMGPRSMLRIRRNEDAVILTIAAQLHGFDFDGRAEPLRVKVTGRPGTFPGLPSEFEFGDTENAVTLRNDPDVSLVVLEREDTTVSQSLAQLPTLEDQDVLGGGAQDAENSVGRVAWAEVAEVEGSKMPLALDQALQSVMEVLWAEDGVAVRRWVEFAIACCRGVAGSAKTEAEIWSIVGGHLPALALLRDRELAGAGSSSARRRRLERNMLFAADRDEAGRDIVADELAGVADATSFVDPIGNPFPEDDNASIRNAIKARLFRMTTEDPPVVDFHVWEQLFAQREQSNGLGYRVRRCLETTAPGRLEEFEQLGLEEPLDRRSSDAAKELIGADPDDPSEPALIDVLETRLRRTLERLAEPRSTTIEDPLRHLVKELYKIQQEAVDQDETTTLTLRPADSKEESAQTLELFRFLFGPTLRSAFDSSEASLLLSVKLDEELVREPGEMKSSRDSAGEESEEDGPDGWDPIVLVLEGDGGEYNRFKWAPREQPGWIALRRLGATPQTAAWHITSDFDSWCLGATVGALDGAVPVPVVNPNGPTERWLDLRHETFQSFQGGLVAEQLTQYFTEWATLLGELREFHSPRNAPVPELASFLSIDTVRSESRRVMLATHPMRLRWLGTHLARCTTDLNRVCDGELRLNSVNEGLYFDTLDGLSAHEQPPILTSDEAIFLAVREDAGHEHFSRLQDDRGHTRHDWLSELDDSSVKVLAGVVHRYLDSHPHKTDGLSLLLVVREGGARVAAELVSSALVRRTGTIPTDLHIVAPEASFPELEEVLQRFDDAELRGASDTPAIHTTLHPWGGDLLPNLSDVDLEVDLAIVPNLFGASTTAMARSRPRAGHGQFEVWGGKTSYIDQDLGEDQGVPNVSRILLPEQPDDALWDWSTINVRQNRGASVSADSDGDAAVDFLSLQVRFNQGAELFERLHQLAHWVVTLDAFIGRAQIELLSSAPDVILMTPRVGKNEAYNLVVSSKSGRDFVVSRLTAKLEAELGALPEGAAEELYDRGRSLFPGLVLRCLGLGWSVQELTGLVLTHHLVQTRRPPKARRGFEAWISLDEQLRWFAGAQYRADAARLEAYLEEDGLKIEVLVVESKFRLQTETSRADQQVSQSMALLRDALTPAETDGELADGRFWRSQILDVAEQSSRRRVTGDRPAALRCWDKTDAPADRIDDEVRTLFLQGAYEVVSVEGIVSTMSPSEAADSHIHPPVGLTAGEHEWYRSGRDGIRGALAALTAAEPEGQRPAPPVSVGTDPVEPVDEAMPEVGDDQTTPGDEAEPSDRGVERDGSPHGSSRKSRAEMESLYQTVLDTFAEFQVAVLRPEEDAYAEGPGFYVFRVKPGPAVRQDALVKLAPELKLKLGLARDFNPSAVLDGGSVVFEVPKIDADRYFVSATDLWNRWPWSGDALSAPVGEDINGDVVGVDFSSSDSPHLLIAGLTGSGKSVALETILHGLSRHHGPDRLRLALIDPKSTELTDFDGTEHLLGDIGFDPEDAIEALERGVEEMQRRRGLFRSVRARSLPDYNSKVDGDARLPWWLIVLDEYADLVSDPQDKKAIEQLLKRLSQKARASGIHVIVATQKPSAEVISTTVRSNLPAQLALRVKTGSDSRIILDEGGAEALAGKGDALLKTARRTVRVQCALYDAPDV